MYLWNRRIDLTRHLDVLPFAGGAAGNTMTYVNAGGHARFGWNKSPFFNTGAMQGTFAGAFSADRPTKEGWVYVGAQAAFIPYNYFLSGGEIEPREGVVDLMYGFSVRYRSYRLTYNFIRRSREFDHPANPMSSAHEYGSIVLSYELIMP
jgi:Uncharacterized protein conserved in bacteria (DUF2219)